MVSAAFRSCRCKHLWRTCTAPSRRRSLCRRRSRRERPAGPTRPARDLGPRRPRLSVNTSKESSSNGDHGKKYDATHANAPDSVEVACDDAAPDGVQRSLFGTGRATAISSTWQHVAAISPRSSLPDCPFPGSLVSRTLRLLLILTVVTVAVTAVALGRWQLRRLAARRPRTWSCSPPEPPAHLGGTGKLEEQSRVGASRPRGCLTPPDRF